MPYNKSLIFGCLSLLCAPIPVFAGPRLVNKPTLSPTQALKPYNDCLNEIQTLKADLTQENPDKTKSIGLLFIEKPGKLRLNYTNGLQLLSDGKKLLCYDNKKKTSDSLALKDTPLDFLLSKGKLEEATHVSTIYLEKNQTRIIVKNKRDPEAGHVELIFNNPRTKNMHLYGWVLSDASGKVTKVALKNIVLNKPVPANLFRIKK